ncbi:MAG: hypothetical protein GTO53_03665 [Planctomycetales bacterium]|nr:hypothetical protein [Planctomycetales bacterium]NIM08261.1 hypothetical protein [Planctomycetales bacterium]NIN07754.1 hypothetical protein [Planctomycetales bacterium]NIN76874.1 hypothetical protein [Planctomycetales bacterium]NIO34073.1 hypothetical protein [Planctomycetales bacterium]
MSDYAGIIAMGLAMGLGIVVLWRLVEVRRRHQLAAARKLFHQRREWLEAKFVELASVKARPRGLNWKDCDFDDHVTFARDRRSGALAAFVAITISFEAIEGGGMEEVEAVGNLRAATAVFQHAAGQWTTAGRAIMNLEPAEAIQRFDQALDLISD